MNMSRYSAALFGLMVASSASAADKIVMCKSTGNNCVTGKAVNKTDAPLVVKKVVITQEADAAAGCAPAEQTYSKDLGLAENVTLVMDINCAYQIKFKTVLPCLGNNIARLTPADLGVGNATAKLTGGTIAQDSCKGLDTKPRYTGS